MVRRWLARAWLGWVLLYGALTVLIVYLPYRLIAALWPPPRRYRIGLRLSKGWAWAVLWGAGIRLKVDRRHAFPPHRPYLLVANHRHELDIPIAAAASPVIFRFLAKAELQKIPLLGFIIASMYVLVDRSDRRSRFQAFLELRKTLESGISVLVFPEGRRNRTEAPLLPFEPGAFRLAIDAGVPVMLLVIQDLKRRLVRHHGKVVGFLPGTVHVVVESVPPDHAATEKELAAYCARRMKALIEA